MDEATDLGLSVLAEPMHFQCIVVQFEIEALDDKVAELKQCGFIFWQDPKDESWLWREARLKDPSDNIICLYFAGINRKNLPWRMAE